MKKLGAVSLCITAFGAATIVAACGPDTTTLPPDYLGDGAAGGSSGGMTGPTGGSTSIAGSSQSATGGSSSLGGTSALGGGSGGTGTGTGGTSVGGGGVAPSLGGGSSYAGTAAAAAGTAGAGQSGGAAGGAATGGASGSGFGFGGRGLGGRGNAGAAGVSGGSSGSAGAAAGSSGGQTVSFAEVGAFIQKTCADAKCHGGKERPSLLNTTPSTLYTTLKNTTVKQCGSDHLATPGDTANSALLELVQHQCGIFVMPDGCTTNPCIDAASLTLLTNWIKEGAPGP